jgi:DNA polymerase III subunit delta'
MPEPEDLPEPDRAEGAPHPRETIFLFGQDQAEQEFLEAFRSGRLHHAWMLTGPRGVGKATLAYRIARFLIGANTDSTSLDMSPEAPVFRRIKAQAEPQLFVCRRPWDEDRKRFKTQITVDEIRRLKSFFQLSASDGGARVAIVDCADELNESAANALLKILEEPPEGAVILLVCHQPAGLLPTIRSRCRVLRLNPLAPGKLGAALDSAGFPPEEDQSALTELAGGSVGEAVRLLADDGPAHYARIVALTASAPRMNRGLIIALGDQCTGPAAAGRYDTIVRLIALALSRLARAGAGDPPAHEAASGERDLAARLSSNPAQARIWADLEQMLSARIAHARAVNLDPGQVILDTFLQIDAAARRAGRSVS